MRKLASVVFASSRRSDRPDTPSDAGLIRRKPRMFPSLSRKHLAATHPPSLPTLVASDLANSSSSSSSGSTTVRTPDDDGLPRTPSKKGSWKSWLGGKNAQAGDRPEEHHPHPWQSSQTVVRRSKRGSNETDVASLHSDDSLDTPDDAPSLSHSIPQLGTAACENARAMIMNSRLHEPTPAPLLQSPDAISFPRSCNNPRRLRRRETLESELHKKSLLARLVRLSPSEQSSIAPLASKAILRKAQTCHGFQNDVFPPADSVSLHSSGLENWVSRPYFEDRLRLWTCSDSGEVTHSRIPGSYLGVAALEFSESLELLAGTLSESDEDAEANTPFDSTSVSTLPPLVLDLGPVATLAKESELAALPPPSDPSDSLVKPPPSPLPGIASLASPVAPSRARPPGDPGSGSAASNDLVPKRGVHFADDDGKDDQIPLGYVLRIRKNKEQKARFLRDERERRQRVAQLSMENHPATPLRQENRVPGAVAPRRPPPRPLGPPRPQQPATASHIVREEDRLRWEAEKIEMEKLRRSRESAKKQAEERERMYTEELQATRARREASRAGRSLESASLSSDRDRSASRDWMHASSRRSSMSHKLSPPHDGSPSSSVLATPGSQYSLSRPPSVYSSRTGSSEDVRGRDSKHFSRRMSVVSDSTKGVSLHPPYDPRASFNPYAWTNVPQIPAVPPVPPVPTIPMVNGIPFYGMDMPLLPPTPPFMINQFGARPRSYTGLSGQRSPLQSSTSLPRNDSFEGINSRKRNSSAHSSESHQRRSSDDASRTARSAGDPRSGSYNDIRGSKNSVCMHGVASQHSSRRSSWLPPEQNPTKSSSSLRPISGSYSSGPTSHVRWRTAAS